MEQFFTQLTNGLAVGGIYALIALGYTMVYGVLKLINFAHGDLFTIGAYLGLTLLTSLALADHLEAVAGILVLAVMIMVLVGINSPAHNTSPGRLSSYCYNRHGGNCTHCPDKQYSWNHRGANGIFGISSPTLFGRQINGIVSPGNYFYLITAFLAVTIVLFYLLENSRFGRALKFLCSDEVAAEGSGINTPGYKLAAFVIGAFWAGMTGTIYAAKIGFISPESFSFWESVVMFMIVILGGSGSIPGVLLGALLIFGLPELFQGLQQYRLLIFGVALMIMMIFRPQGILPPTPRSYPVEKLRKNGVSL